MKTPRLKKGQVLVFTLVIMMVVGFILAGVGGYLTYRANTRNKNASLDREKVSLRTASTDVYQSLLVSSTDYITVATNTTIDVTFSDVSYKAFNEGNTTVTLTYQTGYFTYDLNGTYYKGQTKIDISTSALVYKSLVLTRLAS
jgi:hypothetical protein